MIYDRTMFRIILVFLLLSHTLFAETPDLVTAAGQGDRERVLFLLHGGANVNVKDALDTTPLMAAAEAGHLEIVRDLITAGADVDVKRLDNATALMLSARDGRVEIVRELLRAGADAPSEIWGLTLAAERGHSEIVQELLKAGTPVISPPNTETALMKAAQRGHAEIARILLEAGAEANARDADGYSALIHAVTGGNPEVVRLLIHAGTDVNTKFSEGWTALLFAARDGNTEIVRVLMEAGADPTAREEQYGRTATNWAQWAGKPEIVKILSQNAKTGPADVAGLQDPDPKIRHSSAVALGFPGNKTAVQPLVELLQKEKEPDIRKAIVTALGTIGDKAATPHLIPILRGNPELAIAAIESLIQLKDPAALPSLRKAFWNPQHSAEASRAIFALGDPNYVSHANQWRRHLAVALPIFVLLLTVVIVLIRSPHRSAELLRTFLAIAGSLLGYFLGMFSFFVVVAVIGSALKVVNLRGEWVIIGYFSVAYFYGSYCAFLSFLAPFLRMRNKGALTNAVVMSITTILLWPFGLVTMSEAMVQSNDVIASRWKVFIFSGEHALTLISVLLAVFLTTLVISFPLKSLSQKATLKDWTGFTFLVWIAGISVTFLLQTPLARLLTDFFP